MLVRVVPFSLLLLACAVSLGTVVTRGNSAPSPGGGRVYVPAIAADSIPLAAPTPEGDMRIAVSMTVKMTTSSGPSEQVQARVYDIAAWPDEEGGTVALSDDSPTVSDVLETRGCSSTLVKTIGVFTATATRTDSLGHTVTINLDPGPTWHMEIRCPSPAPVVTLEEQGFRSYWESTSMRERLGAGGGYTFFVPDAQNEQGCIKRYGHYSGTKVTPVSKIEAVADIWIFSRPCLLPLPD